MTAGDRISRREAHLRAFLEPLNSFEIFSAFGADSFSGSRGAIAAPTILAGNIT
jgi:hypothetical protein